MSDEKRTDDGPELEDADVQAVPDQAIDTPETSTVDDPDALRPAHSANISTSPELSDDEREPVVVGDRRGMFGATRGRTPPATAAWSRPAVRLGAPAALEGWFDARRPTSPRPSTRPTGPSFDDAVEKVVVSAASSRCSCGASTCSRRPARCATSPTLRFEICSASAASTTREEAGRELHAVYHLLSMTHGGRRVRLEVTCPDADPHIPSIVDVYPGNDWHERETWDMFGIVFDGHPALTRILMPDDWPGHPQRKDYPLGGIPVEYKGAQIPPPDQRRAYS